jgi:hypothetical protein
MRIDAEANISIGQHYAFCLFGNGRSEWHINYRAPFVLKQVCARKHQRRYFGLVLHASRVAGGHQNMAIRPGVKNAWFKPRFKLILRTWVSQQTLTCPHLPRVWVGIPA